MDSSASIKNRSFLIIDEDYFRVNCRNMLQTDNFVFQIVHKNEENDDGIGSSDNISVIAEAFESVKNLINLNM